MTDARRYHDTINEHHKPHFDWVLIELCRRLVKRMNLQVEGLVEQLLDKVDKEVKQKRAKEGDEDTPRITSLQWDGTDWKMSFD